MRAWRSDDLEEQFGTTMEPSSAEDPARVLQAGKEALEELCALLRRLKDDGLLESVETPAKYEEIPAPWFRPRWQAMPPSAEVTAWPPSRTPNVTLPASYSD